VKHSAETDIISLRRILGYIMDIGECFDHFVVESHADFAANRLAQYAITQIITNIAEIRKDISDATLLLLPGFSRIKVIGARNIASHAYEQVNFRIIYDICGMLQSENVVKELNGVIYGVDGNDRQNS